MRAGVKFYFRPFGKVGLVNEHAQVMRGDAVDDLACALGLMDGQGSAEAARRVRRDNKT